MSEHISIESNVVFGTAASGSGQELLCVTSATYMHTR
jgi:hypothetical protein